MVMPYNKKALVAALRDHYLNKLAVFQASDTSAAQIERSCNTEIELPVGTRKTPSSRVFKFRKTVRAIYSKSNKSLCFDSRVTGTYGADNFSLSGTFKDEG